jgi:hypothetical protein
MSSWWKNGFGYSPREIEAELRPTIRRSVLKRRCLYGNSGLHRCRETPEDLLIQLAQAKISPVIRFCLFLHKSKSYGNGTVGRNVLSSPIFTHYAGAAIIRFRNVSLRMVYPSAIIRPLPQLICLRTKCYEAEPKENAH